MTGPGRGAQGSAEVGGRRALVLLSAGALAGVSLAAFAVLRPPSEALPDDAIARVNGRLIRSESYERLWRRVASDKRNPMSESDRAHVLKRLIEEELLIQRGQAMGLVQSDAAVRKAISSAMIQAIVGESEALQPDEVALQAFYQENRRYFAPSGTLHVRQLLFAPRPGEAAEEARARASAAHEAVVVGGLAFADALERYGDPPLVAIPDTPLPAHKLQQYIGGAGVDRVRALQPQEVSQPFEHAGAVRIFQLVSATVGEPPAFEAARTQVESAFRRDAADRALRDSLERLWQEASVVLSPDAPKGVF